jgi:hypothetical protein
MRAINLADPQAPPRIFVSYARADAEEAARDLVALLTEHALSAWLDHLDLEGGTDWWRQVEAALQRVEHLVLILTPAAGPCRLARLRRFDPASHNFRRASD